MRPPQPGLRPYGARRGGGPGGSPGLQAGRGAVRQGTPGIGAAKEGCGERKNIRETAVSLKNKNKNKILGGMRSLIGQDKPDCYVIVSVGAEEYRFAKIKRSSSTFPTKKSFHCQDSREEGHVRPRLVRRGGVVKFKLIH